MVARRRAGTTRTGGGAGSPEPRGISTVGTACVAGGPASPAIRVNSSPAARPSRSAVGVLRDHRDPRGRSRSAVRKSSKPDDRHEPLATKSVQRADRPDRSRCSAR